MSLFAEILISALLVVGGLFGFIGSYGLWKLDDPMKRLHGPTKATTVGVGAALIASMIQARVVEGRLSWQEALVAIFLFVTSPITAHFLSKANIHRGLRRQDLPPTGTGATWATFDAENQPPAEARSDI
jgi:multicomponent K+:H+ antiporter subunit G